MSRCTCDEPPICGNCDDTGTCSSCDGPRPRTCAACNGFGACNCGARERLDQAWQRDPQAGLDWTPPHRATCPMLGGAP